MVLDNAQDEAQVRPLLPGNRGAVVVTSRRVLGALAGAKVLELDVLSGDVAGDLLAKVVGWERLAAVVQGSDDVVVMEGLERLVDAQLLKADIDGRFRFHDLLRVFAREKLATANTVEEQKEIRQRIVDWGCEQSDFMANCLRPAERRQIVQQWIESGEVAADFDEQDLILHSLAWFEGEREQLLSAIDWANNAERGYILVNLISGNSILSLAILSLVIIFWLLLRFFRNRYS